MLVPHDLFRLEMDQSLRIARKVVRRYGTTIPYLFLFRTISDDQWEMEPTPIVDDSVDHAVSQAWKEAPHLQAIGSICPMELSDREGKPALCIYTCIYTDGGTHVSHCLTQYQVVDEIQPGEKAALHTEYWEDFLEENGYQPDGLAPLELVQLRERFERDVWQNLEPTFLVDFLEYLWDETDAHLAPLIPVA